MQSFRKIRPQISVDPISGKPFLTFTITTEEDALQTLEDLILILKKRSEKISTVVAIDEFQQIKNYPEKNIEALIRGLIQDLHNVYFIFSGSNRSVLAEMFISSKRPFYQSTQMMFLEEIPFDEYKHFIQSKFSNREKLLNENVVEMILKWTRSHTFYVQYLCNVLFEQSHEQIDENLFLRVASDILTANDPFYYEYRNLLTTNQWQLLKAIAKEQFIESYTATSFIRRHNLSNPSTVRRGIFSLLDKEMIYKKKDRYFVYDPFFSRWLEKQV